MTDGQIDWKSNCGNLASALLLVGKLCGHLPPNQSSILVDQVNTSQSMQVSESVHDVHIPGVPGLGKGVEVAFFGDNTHNILPTGNPIDTIDGIECTLISTSNATIFVPWHEESGSSQGMEWIENLRRCAGERMGIPVTSALRVAFVQGNISEYTDNCGVLHDASSFDVRSKITATGGRVFHHAYTGSGSSNLALAARIPGSIVQRLLDQENVPVIRLAHPAGIIEVKSQAKFSSQVGWVAQTTSLIRTARLIMRGFI